MLGVASYPPHHHTLISLSRSLMLCLTLLYHLLLSIVSPLFFVKLMSWYSLLNLCFLSTPNSCLHLCSCLEPFPGHFLLNCLLHILPASNTSSNSLFSICFFLWYIDLWTQNRNSIDKCRLLGCCIAPMSVHCENLAS